MMKSRYCHKYPIQHFRVTSRKPAFPSYSPVTFPAKAGRFHSKTL